MDIITGYTGTPHITAENDRDINIGIFGSKSYVLQTGTMLTAEISNNNEIKVRDGVIMHQGCAASIKKNTYDSVTINNGSQGMKRIDLIVARYEKQPETNVESLTLKVLQGTPVETSPQVPAHTEGDIQAGDTVADMPLYEVEIDGLNITEIRKVFQTMGDLESVNGKIHDKKVLWAGSGIFLNKSQSIPLSESLTNQKRGIVLILSRYENGVAQNYGYKSYFVPKECLDFGVDKPGFDIPLIKYSNNSNVVGSKYIYVSDNKIEGSESNGTSPNSGWVFRYAIGV